MLSTGEHRPPRFPSGDAPGPRLPSQQLATGGEPASGTAAVAAQVLELLARNVRFVALVTISAMLSALALTYVLSEKYRSSTIVLIRPEKSVDLVPKREEILNFPVGFYTPVGTGSNTYSEIVKSRAVAEKIVRALHLDAAKASPPPGLAGLWRRAASGAKTTMMKGWTFLKFGRIPRDTPFNEAVEETMKSLSVRPAKDTYLFEIVAETRSPQGAADIANSATVAFTDYMKEVRAANDAGASRQSQEKLGASAAQLDASRQALADYKHSRGIVSLGKETELAVEALASLDNARQATATKIAGLLARRVELEGRIAGVNATSRASSKVIENPLMGVLRERLANNEVKLARMKPLYGDKHREVQAIVAENETILEELGRTPATVASEEVTQADPLYQNLQAELTKVYADLSSLGAEQAKLDSALRAKKAVLASIPTEEAELARLELAVVLGEEAHKIVSKENEEVVVSAIRSAPTIEVVHQAVPSAYPVSPIKIYNVALAAILGVLISMAWVIVTAQFGQAPERRERESEVVAEGA